MSLHLVAFRPWMWDELWRWQAEHYYENKGEGLLWGQGSPPPREGTIPRPNEPDHALFVGSIHGLPGEAPGGLIVCGLGLHVTKGYIFIDDLTTNPITAHRLRHRAVELILQAAAQYAVSVSKPLCAFTSKRGLYRIARRMGFFAKPQGALLVYATPTIHLEPEVTVSAQKKSGPPLKGPDSPLAERNAYRVRQPNEKKVPRQSVSRVAKMTEIRDGEEVQVKRARAR